MEVIHGSRLWWIVLPLCVGLLLSSLESTIVATALVSIGSHFHDYKQSNWVVVSYLVTYSSFLIIYARLSDITGRKPALLTGLSLFTLASLACGLSHTLTELICFRAFQGIGGAGIYALTLVIVAEITAVEKFGLVSGLLSVVFTVASGVGPIIGGAITTYSTWRWCFYLNIPSGAMVVLLIAFIFPNSQSSDNVGTKTKVARVDWLGAFLCLAASIIIIIPLQEGGADLAWDSASIIVLFVLGGLCWFALAFWELWIAQRADKFPVMPLLPLRVLSNRVIGACTLTLALTGISFTSTIVYLPQRFQVVNSLSPISAGNHMLPLIVTSAVATIFAGLALGKRNICAHLVLCGNALQLVGLGLFSSIHNSKHIPKSQYGYQVILGLGFGISLSSGFVLARIEAHRKDIAPTVGMITQTRVFGGVIGVAISRVVLVSYLTSKLSQIVSPSTLDSIMSSASAIDSLPSDQAASVRQAYSDGFAYQSRILMYIAAGNILLAFATFRRHAKPLKPPAAPAEAVAGEEKTGVDGLHDAEKAKEGLSETKQDISRECIETEK